MGANRSSPREFDFKNNSANAENWNRNIYGSEKRESSSSSSASNLAEGNWKRERRNAECGDYIDYGESNTHKLKPLDLLVETEIMGMSPLSLSTSSDAAVQCSREVSQCTNDETFMRAPGSNTNVLPLRLRLDRPIFAMGSAGAFETGPKMSHGAPEHGSETPPVCVLGLNNKHKKSLAELEALMLSPPLSKARKEHFAWNSDPLTPHPLSSPPSSIAPGPPATPTHPLPSSASLQPPPLPRPPLSITINVTPPPPPASPSGGPSVVTSLHSLSYSESPPPPPEISPEYISSPSSHLSPPAMEFKDPSIQLEDPTIEPEDSTINLEVKDEKIPLIMCPKRKHRIPSAYRLDGLATPSALPPPPPAEIWREASPPLPPPPQSLEIKKVEDKEMETPKRKKLRIPSAYTLDGLATPSSHPPPPPADIWRTSSHASQLPPRPPLLKTEEDVKVKRRNDARLKLPPRHQKRIPSAYTLDGLASPSFLPPPPRDKWYESRTKGNGKLSKRDW
eukprot:CAMPEP_0184479010 /NCGR_PEP_ID=MMETSP0113_2-20130426/878_1 /TAXON_ID=91329 /ORGANISM="Norrisiella sphaerica, Strain BC52" /LENGTH=506 /DNA_ID=CAMNT_0026856985 /DNA_START=392 /DNA_END=1909 /DNA_ORIENTATION=+